MSDKNKANAGELNEEELSGVIGGAASPTPVASSLATRTTAGVTGPAKVAATDVAMMDVQVPAEG